MPKVIDESTRIAAGAATITITADELRVTTDPAELVRRPAEALAERIARDIKTVSARAAPSTVARRSDHSTQKWNRTGKLARSVEAARSDRGYAITVAPDRLEVPVLAERLAADVPSLHDPLTDEVDEALERTLDAMFGADE